jgi:hypothetical protein
VNVQALGRGAPPHVEWVADGQHHGAFPGPSPAWWQAWLRQEGERQTREQVRRRHPEQQSRRYLRRWEVLPRQTVPRVPIHFADGSGHELVPEAAEVA